ncbi:geranylgeranyl pyrophosphate synthase [Microbacterium testaceum StLB037]|uniref:Geranylgeranyl pyrophosphate synthase n=1 Tax=Microbacterium testaceum (strain StLB037) TaxID=979556 RepID=E8NF51_MICTS|nr:geranylgeranyl pyrophosphate synthase [Microbacterium testaceum StLB037]
MRPLDAGLAGVEDEVGALGGRHGPIECRHPRFGVGEHDIIAAQTESAAVCGGILAGENVQAASRRSKGVEEAAAENRITEIVFLTGHGDEDMRHSSMLSQARTVPERCPPGAIVSVGTVGWTST